MAIIVMTIRGNETKPFGKKFNQAPVLFESYAAAEEYIGEKYPSYACTEITERLKEASPWCDNINRTFFVDIPNYDSNGEWDYSTEYTIELQEMDVRKKMK